MMKLVLSASACTATALVAYVVARWGCPWAASPDVPAMALEPDMGWADTLAVAVLPMLALLGSVLFTPSNRHRE